MADVPHARVAIDVSGASPSFPVVAAKVTPELVGDTCRDAFLAFVRGARSGRWTKADLASWLEGPYRAAARLVDVANRPPVVLGAPSSMPPSAHVLEGDGLAALLERASRRVIGCIDALARGGGAFELDEAFDRGTLVECVTPAGERIVVPLHRPGMRLARRVTSLVLADYLVRSSDYEHADTGAGCEACGVVLLGAGARGQGLCNLHMRRSAVVPGPGRAGAS